MTRRLRTLCIPILAGSALALAGCNQGNDENAMAPPMGTVDIPAGAEADVPAKTYTDSSAYAEDHPGDDAK